MNSKPRRGLAKKRLSTKGGVVTIAIGFRFDGGALFCADTKFTGAMVLQDSKIYAQPYGSQAKSIFVIAGNVAYARMAVRQCESAIAQLTHPTLREMAAVIEEQLLDVHRKHIFPHPDRGLVGGPDFWLLIGLWSPVDGLGTYYTAQTALSPFDAYYCVGSGDYLAHYLIKPKYEGLQHTLKQVTVIACTTLIEIKSYDADCGGDSQFRILDNDGWLGQMQQYKVSTAETFSKKFRQSSDLLFTALYSNKNYRQGADEYFEFFKRQVLDAAEKHKQENDSYDALADALSAMTKATLSTSQKSEPGQ
jgi:hypothetical protein